MNYLYGQSLERFQQSRKHTLRNLFLGGLMAAGVAAGYYFTKGYSESNRHEPKQKYVEVKKTTPAKFPKSSIFRKRIEKLRKLGLKEETIEGIITTFTIENPRWNHRVIGGCGERGYGQNLKPVVEDTIEHALASPNGNRTNRAISSLTLQYVRDTSIKERERYILPNTWQNKWKRRTARNKIVRKVYQKLTQNEQADWDLSVAVYLHDTLGARKACEEAGVPFTPSVTDAYHNAPERTREALKHCRENFMQCRYFPTITKNRKYLSFYIPKGLLQSKHNYK